MKYNSFSSIIYSVEMKGIPEYMKNMDHNAHSVYLLYYHLILVVKLLKKEYPEIRQKLWKETFWIQSFCLISAGGAPIEVIRQYIETQGEKDGKFPRVGKCAATPGERV